MFADDWLITDNNEKAYLKEVEGLTCWCQDNKLLLNVSKTRELIVDFGKKQGRNYALSYHQRVLGGEGGQL